MSAGYYRFPTIHQETIIFVSEDDLWRVSTQGGLAHRLTSNHGEVTYPMLSPDGQWVAFVGREEGGPEVYVMDAEGGSERRLTYLNSNCRVLGWSADGGHIIFSSSYGQIDAGEMALFSVELAATNGVVRPLPYGPARSIAFGPHNEVVVGRNTGDPARWKRYRGGTAGHLWIDSNGDGEFQRFLSDLPGNIASPMWLTVQGESRVFFVSDHEGIGNLYSCRPNGEDIRRHTDHESYYVRNPSTDGRSIVYHLGADLYVYDVEADREQRVEIRYRSPRIQRSRKFVDAGRYLDGYALHPSGLAVAITSRGKTFGFYNHEGAVLQYGKRDGVRYRAPVWLCDGKRFVVVTDEPGEEALEIFGPEPYGESVRLENLELGRLVDMKASPIEPKIAITNHRYELLLIDLDSREVTLVDRSRYRNIAGFDWSPDGRWLAYSFGATSQTSEIRLYQLPEPEPQPEQGGSEVASEERSEEGREASNAGPDAAGTMDAGEGPTRAAGVVDATPVAEPAAGPGNGTVNGSAELTLAERRIYPITQPVLHDVQPAFDPEGKYLYFLSYREFNPVYDALHFDLGFPWGMRPYLVTLRQELPNPFVPIPDFSGLDDDEDDEGPQEDEAEDGGEDDEENEGEAGAEGDDEYEDDEYGDSEEDAGDDGEGYVEDDDAGEDGEADQLKRSMRPAARRRMNRPFYIRAEARPEAPNEPASRRRGGKSRKNGKGPAEREESPRAQKGPKPLRIDLEGIQTRLVAFPVPDARYGQVAGVRGKAIFTVFPVTGQLDTNFDWDDEEPDAGQLRAYDFKDYRDELLADRVASFDISANGKKLIYTTGTQLRVINAGEKAPGGGPPRKSGWIPLHRVKISVNPQSEWEQMFREAWRLQRDHFWTEDMSQVDWQEVFTRYFELISRVSTRSELSDLLWEMQGELGTSHAYEFGGDYRPRPYYGQGFLGAEYAWDENYHGYRIEKILQGDPWVPEAHSPLLMPGNDIRPGDVLININGQMLDEEIGPGQLLVNQARHEVMLVFKRPDADPNADGNSDGDANSDVDSETVAAAVSETPVDSDSTTGDETSPPNTGAAAEFLPELERTGEVVPALPIAGGIVPGDAVQDAETEVQPDGDASVPPRRKYITVVTRTLTTESQVRYRQWVNHSRARVHAATQGRIGYVHIPDMGAAGYAEFHRGYLAEVDRDGLIVDVRYNGGGHVSQLILEKLARRRIGYDLSRWGGLIPYPMESVAGPIVALANEHAGSDGDIFCHSFKLMKLGPLVGKRTWGGVIGISPQHALVDGTVTTQPEYSFWFEDVGWNVENYGTDPDIEVDNRPQDYVAGVDAQLEQAIREALRLLESNPVRRPSLDARPSRALPILPPRAAAAQQGQE